MLWLIPVAGAGFIVYRKVKKKWDEWLLYLIAAILILILI